MLINMNIRDLKYIIALADYSHFGKAAKACFVSQPALSMQIQKLEDNLGIKLFERTNKKVITTDAGKEIIKHARNIIREAKDIEDIAKTMQSPLSGNIKIGAFPTLAPYLFSKIIPSISKKMPNIKLFLIEEKTHKLIKKLEDGDIDCAFLTLPVNNNIFELKELFCDEFFLAVPKNHQLSNKKEIEKNDLKNENLLLLEEGHCLRDQSLDICNMMNISEKQDFRATSIETLRQMVISNIGMTLMPKIAINKNDDIIYIRFTNPQPSRTIALIWRKTSYKEQYFNKISDIVIKEFG